MTGDVARVDEVIRPQKHATHVSWCHAVVFKITCGKVEGEAGRVYMEGRWEGIG